LNPSQQICHLHAPTPKPCRVASCASRVGRSPKRNPAKNDNSFPASVKPPHGCRETSICLQLKLMPRLVVERRLNLSSG
jgi:hypothetical protein